MGIHSGNRKIMRKKTAHCYLVVLIVLTLSITAGNAQNATPGRETKPNIIFILTDDQRWDALGFAGNKIIQTPEMDRLAQDGVYFGNAFVTTPICAASRASILTGLYERTHGYTFEVEKVPDEYMAKSYPQMLRNNGYYTGFFGKLGVNKVNRDALFDVSDVYDRNGRFTNRRGYYYKTLQGDTVHLTRYTGEQAMAFIESAPDDKPFCLSISFSAPHAHDPAPDQYFWEPELDRLYRDVVIPGPQLGEDHYFDDLPLIVREGINRKRWTWRFDTPEKYQESVKGYFRMISGVDREIGKIRDVLKNKGLADNTIIILMGDNGYFLGERQLAGKWLMYENALRVPLIIYDPRAKGGLRPAESVLNIDVPATMLDFAGVEIPAHWQGRSLEPLVEGKSSSLKRDAILFEHLWQTPMIPPSEAVRTDEWKYLRYINDKSIEELYNLEDDPMEIHNLAGDSKYRKVLLKLRKECDRQVARYSK